MDKKKSAIISLSRKSGASLFKIMSGEVTSKVPKSEIRKMLLRGIASKKDNK